jgi:hypothetical protein
VNNEEAVAILRDHLQIYRRRSYAELVALRGKPQVTKVDGSSGTKYQLEVDVNWDDRPGGNIRVLGAIDDGGSRAFKPLTHDFILAPNGVFVGE